MSYYKWTVIPLVTLALLGGLLAGALHFGWPENKTTARELNGPWHYEVDTGQTGELFLPWDLKLPLRAKQVGITIMLPEWEKEGYALHFSSMQQAVEVKVGGDTRYTYGASVHEEDFVYQSATHINCVPLDMADSGKILTILYSAPPLFRIELGLIREVWFGTESDLVLRQFRISVPVMLAAALALLSVLSTLLMLATYQGTPLRANFCTLLLTVIVILPLSAEFAILWPVFHYAPRLSILYDWDFFFFNALIAPAAWLTMYASGWSFRGWRGRAAHLYGYTFVVTVVLSLFGLFNFNLTRPFFMCANILLTVSLLVDRKKHGGGRNCGLALPTLILLGGYYLDYLKYCLMLLPISAKWSVFFQLMLPFQFFTCIALVVFSMLVLRETMSGLANRQSAVWEENLRLQNSQQLLQQSSQTMVQRLILMNENTRQMRIHSHDQRHLNNTLFALLEKGDTQKAMELLQSSRTLAHDISQISYCENVAANAAISYYSALARQRNVQCEIHAQIPTELTVDSLELTMVISNLLENAVNACSLLKSVEKRCICMTILCIGQLVMETENPYQGEVLLDENGYPTSEQTGHGIGTKSILAFVERYGGEVVYRITDGVFNVRILI